MDETARRIDLRCAILRLCCLVPLLPAASGCSLAGGSLTVCPNDHKLLESAKSIASCIDRFAPAPRELQKLPIEAYYVQPGDVLLLEVTDFETDVRLPVDQTVMPDGTIDLAEFGRPVAAGLTVEQIEERVRRAVQKAKPESDVSRINVRLSVAESAVFYVLGEVNAPGAYPLIGRETVLDALMTAGGLSDRASNCGIILSRPTPPGSCRVVLPICYRQIVQLGDTTTNYQIEPGDRLYVSTRSLCEQLMFWRRGCELCCEDCSPACPSPVAPAASPFLLQPQPSMSEPTSERPILLFTPVEPEPLFGPTE